MGRKNKKKKRSNATSTSQDNSFKQNVSNPNSQDNQDTECSLSESITTANSSSDIHVLPAESIASNREIKSSDTGRNSQFQQTRPRKSSCNIDESEVAESEMKDISQVNQESKRQYNLETKDNDHDKFEKNLGESSNNQFKSHSKEYRRNSNKNDTQRKESSNDRWGHGQENRKGHSSHENSNSYASQGSSGDKNRRYRDNESKPCPKNDGGENAECVPSDDSNKLRNKSNDRSNRKHNNYEGKPMLRNKAPDQEHVGENSDWKSQNSNKFRNKSGDRSNRYENYIGNDRSQNKIPDQEYDKFKTRYMSSRDDVMDCKVVQEIEGDLFTAGTEYSLGHCVSEDMNMGSGIAVLFRREFKRVDELLSQRRTQGNVAILEDKGRFIYYLVTKRASFGKPTYHTLWLSLQKMKDHIRTNNVKKLALPRIGCGLDSLEWKYVKNMLEYIFQNVDIQIVIYNFQQDSSSTTQTKLRKCPVVNTQKLLSEIDTGTIMVYFGSEDGYETQEITDLSRKFPYIRINYKCANRVIGGHVYTERHRDGYIFYGCIVRKKSTDLFSFTDFQKSLKSIQAQNRKDQYNYIAFQAFLEEGSSEIVSKIVNLMRFAMTNVDVYVCWPENLSKYMALR